MTDNKKPRSKKLITRRDFLAASGAVIAAGALTACTPKTVTETVTTTAPPSTVTPAAITNTVTSTVTVNPSTAKLVVFDPRGTPSPITLVPMAKRLDTLDDKTIYVVDINYPYTDVFCKEVTKILQEKYPKTTWIYRSKYGTYAQDDPDTWDLIQAKGHGMVVLVGH